MRELFEMPSNLPKPETHEEVKQYISLEFDDMEKRAEALKIINKLRDVLKNTEHNIFEGLQAITIDWERKEEGLTLSFSTVIEGRDQVIKKALHGEGIGLKIKDGVEEMYTKNIQAA